MTEKTVNENVLRGMMCPKCGALEPFDIEATTTFLRVGDDGTDLYEGADWTDKNSCRCCTCDKRGKVKDFYPKYEVVGVRNGTTILQGLCFAQTKALRIARGFIKKFRKQRRCSDAFIEIRKLDRLADEEFESVENWWPDMIWKARK